MERNHVYILAALAVVVLLLLLMFRAYVLNNYGIVGNRKKYLGTGAAIKLAILRYDQIQTPANPYYNYFAQELAGDATGRQVFPASGRPSLFIVGPVGRAALVLPQVLEVALDKTQTRIKNHTFTPQNMANDARVMLSDPTVLAAALADVLAMNGTKDGFTLSSVPAVSPPLCCAVGAGCPANSLPCG